MRIRLWQKKPSTISRRAVDPNWINPRSEMHSMLVFHCVQRDSRGPYPQPRPWHHFDTGAPRNYCLKRLTAIWSSEMKSLNSGNEKPRSMAGLLLVGTSGHANSRSSAMRWYTSFRCTGISWGALTPVLIWLPLMFRTVHMPLQLSSETVNLICCER